MESFGLFDLFKSLLSPNEAENTPVSPESDQPAPQPVQTDEEENAQSQAQAPNAFLDFIHNHDERAKRTKRK